MISNHSNPDFLQKASKSYWLNQFKEEIPLLELPFIIKSHKDLTFKRKILEKSFNNELCKHFISLLQTSDNELNIGLLSLINILLFRYTNQEDIVIGSRFPTLELPTSPIYKVINFPLRCRCSGFDSFITLINKNKQLKSEAEKYSDFSFEFLKEEIKHPESTFPDSLFNVLVLLENSLYTNSIVEEISYNSSFHLIFTFKQYESKFVLEINYNSELFEDDSINLIFYHIEELMKSVIENPNKEIGLLEYLTFDEKDKLINHFNNVNVSFPKSITMIDLFEESVNRFPHNTALTFENSDIAYNELNKRSNQLARTLIKKGVVKDVLVPIMIERSFNMLIGILGILKAGGAYVPIDPDYPSERINYILNDTSAKILICNNSSCNKLTNTENIEIVNIEADWNLISLESEDNLLLSVSPSDLAYVIYTSGSTGMPKGVLIEHRNVVRLFKTDISLFDFKETDVWTMFHSFTFDFSVWEMYGALFYGGRLVIVPKEVTKDLSLYAELISREGATILNQTPSAFYILQEYLVENTDIVPMRYIIFGGEALSPDKLKIWNDLHPETKLINMYGITETTVHVTYQEIKKEHINSGKSMIGSPIPTLTTFILDNHQNLTPIGIVGELCVGGEGLARGYLNRPELTAERFIKNKFSKLIDSRLYRSGDLGRRLSDGNIEYLGRMDNQVKIRGYRIELGEIENIIRKYPSIDHAIVIVKGSTSADRHLVAFVVSKTVINKSELIAYLQFKLPEYMIPSYFEQVKEIPLTNNGKIDTKTLLSTYADKKLSGYISNSGSTIQNNQTTPKKDSDYERISRMILSTIGISINDKTENLSFIELGLNSLLLTQFAHNLKREFGIKISFRQLTDSYNTPGLLIEYVSKLDGFHSIISGVKTTNDSDINQTEKAEQLINKSSDFINPPLPGARLGRDQNGNPAWFIMNPNQPGKYMQLIN